MVAVTLKYYFNRRKRKQKRDLTKSLIELLTTAVTSPIRALIWLLSIIFRAELAVPVQLRAAPIQLRQSGVWPLARTPFFLTLTKAVIYVLHDIGQGSTPGI